MAYKIHYSDYPGTDTGPPDPDRWVGPPGPPGPTGPQGPQGPQGIAGNPFPEAPNDGALYGRGGATVAWTPVLPIAGGTLTGSLTVKTYAIIAGTGGTPSQLFLDNDVLGQRMIAGRAGGATRWTILPGDTTAETGSNAGADFAISRYSDAGGFIDNPLTISRATGAVTCKTLVLSGLPTSATGLPTGAVWNNGGVLCIV